MSLLSEVYEGLFEGMPLSTMLVYFICVVIGVFINWAKVCNEKRCSMREYWTTYPIRSRTAIMGTLGAFLVTAMTEPTSGKLTYLAIGFACDSLLNKPPADRKMVNVMDKLAQDGKEKARQINELQNQLKKG